MIETRPLRKYGNMEGVRVGKLTVIKELERRVEKNGRLSRNLYCRCDCGKEVEMRLSSFVEATSCGCIKIEKIKSIPRSNPHGQSKSRIYRIHTNMMNRCYRKTHHNYKHYGGRGITVCNKWHDFNNFYNDMVPTYADNLTLDRINNDGNYEKSNCKWETIEVQSNKKRSSRYIECDGEVHTLSQWAKIGNVGVNAISQRLARGFSTHDAIFMPPIK